MSHTPGPWDDIDGIIYGGAEDDRVKVCVIDKMRFARQDDNWDANAKLIAAAPDMLETLHRIVEELEISECQNDHALRLAVQAIERAVS